MMDILRLAAFLSLTDASEGVISINGGLCWRARTGWATINKQFPDLSYSINIYIHCVLLKAAYSSLVIPFCTFILSHFVFKTTA